MSPSTQTSVSEDDARRADGFRRLAEKWSDGFAEAFEAEFGVPLSSLVQGCGEADAIRRAEELAQGTLDLAHRMCYDYGHEIKNWEIDE